MVIKSYYEQRKCTVATVFNCGKFGICDLEDLSETLINWYSVEYSRQRKKKKCLGFNNSFTHENMLMTSEGARISCKFVIITKPRVLVL